MVADPLADLRARCDNPQPGDVFAAYVARLRAKAARGEPLSDPDIMAKAMRTHAALTPLRLKANDLTLED